LVLKAAEGPENFVNSTLEFVVHFAKPAIALQFPASRLLTVKIFRFKAIAAQEPCVLQSWHGCVCCLRPSPSRHGLHQRRQAIALCRYIMQSPRSGASLPSLQRDDLVLRTSKLHYITLE